MVVVVVVLYFSNSLCTFICCIECGLANKCGLANECFRLAGAPGGNCYFMCCLSCRIAHMQRTVGSQPSDVHFLCI